MQFTKTKEVKSPKRANNNDAGIDFFIPEMSVKDLEHINLEEMGCLIHAYLPDHPSDNPTKSSISSLEIRPGGRCLIPSGIHVRLEPGTALILMNKSGVASKLGLDVGACVVDESYTGEIHINLINTSFKPVVIKPGQKIVQGLIFNMNCAMPSESESLEVLYDGFETDRGAGGFGSTGVS